MAHTKAQGSTTNGRDSQSKRLGIKRYGGEAVLPGAILLRQRGTQFLPGRNVGLGSDFTIFSKIAGKVKFEWAYRGKKRVSVYPPADGKKKPLSSKQKKAAAPVALPGARSTAKGAAAA